MANETNETEGDIRVPPPPPKKGHKLAFAAFLVVAIILDSLEIILEALSAALIFFFGVGLAVEAIIKAADLIINPIFSAFLWFWGWRNNAQGLSTVIWTGIVEVIPWVGMLPANTYAVFRIYGQIQLTERLHLQAANQALAAARALQANKLKRMRRRRAKMRAQGISGVRASGQIPKTRTRSMLQSIRRTQRGAERAEAARAVAKGLTTPQKLAELVPGSLRHGAEKAEKVHEAAEYAHLGHEREEEGEGPSQRERRLRELEQAKLQRERESKAQELGLDPEKARSKATDLAKEDASREATRERLAQQTAGGSGTPPQGKMSPEEFAESQRHLMERYENFKSIPGVSDAQAREMAARLGTSEAFRRPPTEEQPPSIT